MMTHEEIERLIQGWRDALDRRGYLPRWVRDLQASMDSALILLHRAALEAEEPLAQWDGWYPTYASPDSQPVRYAVYPRFADEPREEEEP